MNGQRWSIADARRTWSIANWGEGYFDVGDDGTLRVHPRRADGPDIALPAVVAAAQAQGLRLPLLVRFSDILRDRLARLQSAFAKAMREWDYPGGYTAIYPIKVNQQKGVAGELAASGGEGFGLEAGSKPELMAVLALAKPGSLVICNGYKDREYVRLALIGRKLGLEIYIVIEKPSELAHVIEEARALGVEPLLGVRMRLASLGAGKWQNTGGDKGKFGLTPRQLLDLLDRAESREALAHVAPAAFPHGLADVERARHRRRHARGGALRRRAREGRRRRSTTSTSAAASASITKARARARTARSTTASNNTRRRSCSRSPKPSRNSASSRRAC